MCSISVPIIIRNAVKLKYPLDKCVYSVVGLSDEILLCVDNSSEDDTLEYIFDLSLEINASSAEHGTVIRTIYSKWDLNNISSTGAEFARQTNIAMNACTCDWVFSAQCDEAIHEADHFRIKQLVSSAAANNIDAYSMTRIYFYGDINTVRDDWTVPITRLFKKGTRKSCGDAMNTSGEGKVVHCDVPIYHYSRIGDPNVISRRILSLDSLFHSKEKLLTTDELEPYDFKTRNFDCMHKNDVDVGKIDVEPKFSKFVGTHPAPFVGYKG